jgi:hypothetical protein
MVAEIGIGPISTHIGAYIKACPIAFLFHHRLHDLLHVLALKSLGARERGKGGNKESCD